MNIVRTTRHLFQRGFTLIEMLVVIVIIGLLIALTMPSLMRTMEANRLTAAGEGFTNRLSQAQQLASSRNKRMQIWFIHTRSGGQLAEDPPSFRSYVVCEVSSTGAQARVIAGPFPVEAGVIIADSPTLSPLITGPNIEVPTTMSTDATASASVIELSPDGGMRKMSAGGAGSVGGLAPSEVMLAQSFITFVNDDPLSRGAALPKNFYTVQVDPYTARARTFRPQVR